MANAAADIEKQLVSIIDYVRDCETRVHRGEIMDLQGLDKNVFDICEAVAALPRPEAQPLEAKMNALIEKLEDLADSMRVQQEKMTGAGG